jgi:uncharacterized membrane protein HdeD (DUF308 family)
MKTVLNVLGGVLVLLGAIWFLQGINLLPGSFMTGQIQWAINGGIALVVGIVLLVMARRQRPRSDKS